MGSEWQKTTLGQIANESDGVVDGPFGSNLPASCYVPSGNPVIRGSNLSLGSTRFKSEEFVYVPDEVFEKLKRSECLPDDILFTKKGTLGQTGIIPRNSRFERFLLSSNQMRLRVNKKVADPNYIYYFVSSERSLEKIKRESEATGVPKINLKYLKSFEINLPPLEEQRRVVSVLGCLDNKIQLNRQTNQTLEQMAQALFKSWFVDFDPVIDNALAAGNPIPPELEQKAAQRAQVRAAAKVSQAKPDAHPHHHASELPQHLRELFPSEFEHTEALGWVPKGWEAGTVGNCFDVTMGQSPPGSTYNENGEGLPFFQGKTDYGFRFPTNRIYCTEPKRVANKSDTLISVRAPVGDVNMALEKCILGRGVAAARHKSGSISYTYYSMKQLEGHFKVFESEGTVFGSINQKDFKALAVIKPCEEVTDIFERLAKSFDEKIEAGTYSINELTKLRDTLLPKLISGELRLPEAETDAPSLTDEASV